MHTHAEGKGLGLYLVKTQVEALKGVVSVKSAPDSGSTFTVKLPPMIC
jgi:chemotaxis protein histidine kinase CheA